LIENFFLTALTQGIFYVLTGIWPLVSIESFQLVTGPKHDLWLVKTIGAILSVIGITLIIAAIQQEAMLSTAVLAIGSAVVLAGVDIIYFKKRIITAIYLLDALAELLFIAWWTTILFVNK
jgi:hypothetical protein